MKENKARKNKAENRSTVFLKQYCSPTGARIDEQFTSQDTTAELRRALHQQNFSGELDLCKTNLRTTREKNNFKEKGRSREKLCFLVYSNERRSLSFIGKRTCGYKA